MRRILIISPHYPPSNLAAVHRSRLFAQHLPSFGWEPIILTVHEHYYEEALDYNLLQLLPSGQRIEKVKAFPVTRPRLIGDIGLRSFFQLRRKALELVIKEGIDFVYILIPSFYVSLLGPYLFRKTGIKYGIDYIDPWVHVFPGSERIFSRHWWSTRLAGWLEPMAVKNASLITGVSEGYYLPVLERNSNLKGKCITGAMPYGAEPLDFEKIRELRLVPGIFSVNKKIKLVYAGALLPKSFSILNEVFSCISAAPQEFNDVEFYFIGTGRHPNDPNGFSVRPIAEKYGLWGRVVFEHPQRVSYAEVLVHLEGADGIFILGSTEAHYTPSKMFQAVLSGKPVLALLHHASSALAVLEKTKAGIALTFSEDNMITRVRQSFVDSFTRWLDMRSSFAADVYSSEFEDNYSAFASTQKLAELLESLSGKIS